MVNTAEQAQTLKKCTSLGPVEKALGLGWGDKGKEGRGKEEAKKGREGRGEKDVPDLKLEKVATLA